MAYTLAENLKRCYPYCKYYQSQELQRVTKMESRSSVVETSAEIQFSYPIVGIILN